MGPKYLDTVFPQKQFFLNVDAKFASGQKNSDFVESQILNISKKCTLETSEVSHFSSSYNLFTDIFVCYRVLALIIKMFLTKQAFFQF